ncbi:MAG: hypothetical protein KatS3mg126_2489 [Lysobacteraceae bacterium]|nr:MAG: hypothetical protein KatS3mg126_2489 [Xanthomonadaceae bacterium]
MQQLQAAAQRAAKRKHAALVEPEVAALRRGQGAQQLAERDHAAVVELQSAGGGEPAVAALHHEAQRGLAAGSGDPESAPGAPLESEARGKRLQRFQQFERRDRILDLQPRLVVQPLQGFAVADQGRERLAFAAQVAAGALQGPATMAEHHRRPAAGREHAPLRSQRAHHHPQGKPVPEGFELGDQLLVRRQVLHAELTEVGLQAQLAGEVGQQGAQVLGGLRRQLESLAEDLRQSPQSRIRTVQVEDPVLEPGRPFAFQGLGGSEAQPQAAVGPPFGEQGELAGDHRDGRLAAAFEHARVADQGGCGAGGDRHAAAGVEPRLGQQRLEQTAVWAVARRNAVQRRLQRGAVQHPAGAEAAGARALFEDLEHELFGEPARRAQPDPQLRGAAALGRACACLRGQRLRQCIEPDLPGGCRLQPVAQGRRPGRVGVLVGPQQGAALGGEPVPAHVRGTPLQRLQTLAQRARPGRAGPVQEQRQPPQVIGPALLDGVRAGEAASGQARRHEGLPMGHPDPALGLARQLPQPCQQLATPGQRRVGRGGEHREQQLAGKPWGQGAPPVLAAPCAQELIEGGAERLRGLARAQPGEQGVALPQCQHPLAGGQGRHGLAAQGGEVEQRAREAVRRLRSPGEEGMCAGDQTVLSAARLSQLAP